VALKYGDWGSGAPTILAMGRGHQAQEIIRWEKEAGL